MMQNNNAKTIIISGSAALIHVFMIFLRGVRKSAIQQIPP